MNNNIFAQNARIAATMTTTENGHAAASTTGSAVLDLYGQVGALRGQDKIRILNLLEKAFKDDLLLATRTVFYARDCRGGTGERELFRLAICWMAQNYTDILRKNLHCIPFYGRWDDLYALVGTKLENEAFAAMNTPQDLVHAYGAYTAWDLRRKQDDPTIELMWKNLPDYVDSDENVLCMVDVSGSMDGRPIEVSTGLGIYFAQKNRGAFHNLFMTFESVPKFVSLTEGASLLENLCEILDSDWGGSTDLNLACKELLRFAIKNNVPQADMPTRLLIISDMEIDNACGIYRWDRSHTDFSKILFIDELREMYRRAGYKMPQVIFWNVESRDNHFHTKSDVPGTMLASGSSPAVFKAVMAMEDLEVTPYDAMVEVLNGERYSRVTV